MILSQTAQYALRAMSVLAGLEPAANLISADLAARTDIPPHYVSKVMRKLVLGGLVRAQKGHGGGFALARPASKILFADILKAADVDLEGSRCAFGLGACNLESPCALHPAWSKLNEQIVRWAKTTTLTDARTSAPSSD